MKKIKIKFIKLLMVMLLEFLDLEDQEAGALIKAMVRYAVTGERPHFKDHYQECFYKRFLDIVEEQIESAAKKSDQCREASLIRSKRIKAGKIALSNEENEKKHKGKKTSDATSSTVTVDNGSNANISIVSIENQSDRKVPSYDDLLSQGIKEDTTPFYDENGRKIWKDMADDDKIAAYTHAPDHKDEYAYRYLTHKVWQNT